MPDRRWKLALLAAIALALLSPDVANAVCQARDDDIFYAVDCDGDSETGAIQEAIDACGKGFDTNPPAQGCIILLPRGEVEIKNTITVGGLHRNDEKKAGIVLRGHGGGFETIAEKHPGGTTLICDEPGGTGPVIEIFGTLFSRFEDFVIDGDKHDDGVNQADVGIDYRGDGNNINTKNVFDTIYITDTHEVGIRITGDPVGSSDHVDTTLWHNIHIEEPGDDCVHLNAVAALVHVFHQLKCRTYENVGFEFEAGSAHLYSPFFGGLWSSGPLAAVRIGRMAREVVIVGMRAELDFGAGIKTTNVENPVSRNALISGSIIGIKEADEDCLHYRHSGSLAFTGNLYGVRGGNSDVDVVIDPVGARALWVLAQGNTFGALDGTWTVSGRVTQGIRTGPWKIADACIASDGDRHLFHDTNCDGAKDPGENFID
jgi:hypothetical protein